MQRVEKLRALKKLIDNKVSDNHMKLSIKLLGDAPAFIDELLGFIKMGKSNTDEIISMLYGMDSYIITCNFLTVVHDDRYNYDAMEKLVYCLYDKYKNDQDTFNGWLYDVYDLDEFTMFDKVQELLSDYHMMTLDHIDIFLDFGYYNTNRFIRYLEMSSLSIEDLRHIGQVFGYILGDNLIDEYVRCYITYDIKDIPIEYLLPLRNLSPFEEPETIAKYCRFLVKHKDELDKYIPKILYNVYKHREESVSKAAERLLELLLIHSSRKRYRDEEYFKLKKEYEDALQKAIDESIISGDKKRMVDDAMSMLTNAGYVVNREDLKNALDIWEDNI